jgi:AcrR family transcriptional regulator
MNRAVRPYEMTARAESAAETSRRIIAALREVAAGRFLEQITLEEVAERAGVATRTIIRKFGGRDGLIEAAFAVGNEDVELRRAETPRGDVEAAVAVIFEDYERHGDALIMLLAQERSHTALLKPLLDSGRKSHSDWVTRVFTPRDRLHAAQLIAATDVYFWKLLRRDLGLSRDAARIATAQMVAKLL